MAKHYSRLRPETMCLVMASDEATKLLLRNLAQRFKA